MTTDKPVLTLFDNKWVIEYEGESLEGDYPIRHDSEFAEMVANEFNFWSYDDKPYEIVDERGD